MSRRLSKRNPGRKEKSMAELKKRLINKIIGMQNRLDDLTEEVSDTYNINKLEKIEDLIENLRSWL